MQNNDFKNNVISVFDLLNRPLNSLGLANNVNGFKCDISENEDSYTLVADLPGAKKEDLKIDYIDGVLYIKASHHKVMDDLNHKYLLQERLEGDYKRAFRFDNIDIDNIEASFNDGELTVNLKKKVKPVKEILIH